MVMAGLSKIRKTNFTFGYKMSLTRAYKAFPPANKIYAPQHVYLGDMSCNQGLTFLEFGHMEHKSHLDIFYSLRPHNQNPQNKNHLKTSQYYFMNFCKIIGGGKKKKKK